jgi:AraC-like DNA-binding protein
MNEGARTVAVSDYREYAPPRALANHFLCFWTQSISGGSEYAHRVLPDGCIDIVFMNDEPPIVAGPWVKHFIAPLPTATRIVGARWHPGRAPTLLGLPAVELLNQFVPLRDVWGRTLSLPFERVSEQPSLSARRSVLGVILLNRLMDAAASDPVVNASIDWMGCHPNGRVRQLSRWVGISDRQLQRRFSAAVGYGPKVFQSILRFQRLLHFARRANHRRSLAALSALVGYADQAHMTREVHRLSGCPPTVLFRKSQCALQMSDFFKTADEDY